LADYLKQFKMRFAIASEGRTDYTVLKNLLMGFFNNKNLPITPLRPKDREPFGWGNLLKYIASQDFKEDCDDGNIDYVIIQIDTKECADWNEGLSNIGNEVSLIEGFINQVIQALIGRIGNEFYNSNKDKIIFAICVHEMECWLLPFHATQPAHYSKVVGCVKAIDLIAAKKGYSINQKDYAGGKHYDDLSKEMKNKKELMQKYHWNPGLKYFINALINSICR
jgi:hypothetical protein